MTQEKTAGHIGFRSIARRLFRYALIAFPVVLILSLSVLAGKEYYTGRSDFCGTSCHIMEPYYKSWQRDIHATKANAGCVDCHYRPGERHTVKAKLKGLSQLLSYFSGRSGGARPRPRVPDDGCLRRGCHAKSEFMDTVLEIKDVKFVHTKHMTIDPDQIAANSAKLSELTIQLKTSLDSTTFAAVQQLAILAGDPEKSRQMIRQLVDPARTDPTTAGVAGQYISAMHRDIRLKQLGNLQCSSCHAHNDDEEHFSVSRQTCYLCHFVNQQFNTETARCLGCHKPPSIAIPVHGSNVPEGSADISGASAGTMDHAVIVANNVNCASCHADLVSGTGQVTRQRCAACHDLSEYYEDFDNNLNTKTVGSLHKVHTSNLHALCSDCHEQIDHALQTKDYMVAEGGFLTPVLDNCAHCHPNHHRGHVELLAGAAPSPIPAGMPNAMFGSRVNCLGCHTTAATDPKGTPLIEATRQACVACHSNDYDKLFDQWVSRLDAGIKDARFLATKATKQLEELGESQLAKRSQASQLIQQGNSALQFVASFKGIHNRNYALELLDYASEKFNKAIELMAQPAALDKK